MTIDKRLAEEVVVEEEGNLQVLGVIRATVHLDRMSSNLLELILYPLNHNLHETTFRT